MNERGGIRNAEGQQPSFVNGQPPPTGASTDTQQSLDNVGEPEVPFSPENTTEGPEADPRSESDEDQPGASTRAAQSKQSPPYLIIGAGLLVVVGAFVGQWILSPVSSPIIPRNSSTQSEGITPDLAPAPMVLVPSGEFMMGARQDDQMAAKDERMAHTVHLDAFYIDQYEVTTARYARFLQETKRPAPKYWSDQIPQRYGNKPVIGVDWNDATAYCVWAGRRLPTEAEWEKAARGTDQRLYPWGNTEPSQQRANFDHCCDFNIYEVLTDVGSFEGGKSPYDVYDMAGSVWEWVADWYDESYYSKSPESNPTGPSSGEKRVLRGGAWDSTPVYVRSGDRLKLSPTFRHDNIGFRCAQDAPK
ncbi:MAG: SUMF1/EgtB/PvdO family nonheme iron enzyme [Nitrospira sp.]|nr:SUMF1/EgtB/PvdO family nonheme iron enzyme [Nitrospira sp.]